jgi:hypothetical protein
MFDLEQAILEWRRQMLAAGIRTPEAVDELEGHLRDDVEAQRRSGIAAERAFENAVQRLGSAALLKKEFAKTAAPHWRLLRKLKAALPGFREIPIPALDDFAPAARQTLELAPEEARHFHHDFVGTEHVLLGLAQSQSAIVSNIMRRLGISAEAVRQEIEKVVFFGPAHPAAANIPLTPRARKALQLAAVEARKLNQPRVNPEHIFLGLILEGSGVAALVLKNLGVRIERAREETLKEMRASSGSP